MKEATKHTPGPWKCAQESVDPEWRIVTTESGLIIANVNDHHRQEANAHLIAAAPTLIDFVQKRAIAGDNEAIEIVEALYAKIK
jgi:hypothetical protein